MNERDKYLPCGNEMISIPELRESDASILSISLLHMGYKGMIEIRGTEDKPLFTPFISVDGYDIAFKYLKWKRENYWIPHFTENNDFKIEGTILTPIGERGFIYSLSITNNTDTEREFTLGLRGTWDKTIQAINESKPVNGKKYVYHSNWNKSIVLDLRSEAGIFSFAPVFEEGGSSEYVENEGIVNFAISNIKKLQGGETFEQSFYWGFGYEEVGAATAGIEMKRKGYRKLYDGTMKWLEKRIRKTGDMILDEILNTNLFFNFFYSSGITLDTEEFVLVTSRSPRYYVSAAYWDRDSLLWSFPAILLVDKDYAKEILNYVFTRQIKNVGIHSRYIDGTVLELGFELDELCAPIIALRNYIDASKDSDYLYEGHIIKGIDRILKLLESKKHPVIDLYETFLQPTDDMHVYPYITYDNVLVYKILKDISFMYEILGKAEQSIALSERAEKVKKAIWENCIISHKDKRIFAWSVDLKGGANIYDEPPGSLELLPFYGFCGSDEEVYKNTVDVIRDREYIYSFSDCRINEIGCAHAPHPWVLSLANSLLCGRKAHGRDILSKIVMDNGIACESVDENTGECTTGEAFATCAGFLAYGIYSAFHL